jgi:hypothetical protein
MHYFASMSVTPNHHLFLFPFSCSVEVYASVTNSSLETGIGSSEHVPPGTQKLLIYWITHTSNSIIKSFPSDA